MTDEFRHPNDPSFKSAKQFLTTDELADKWISLQKQKKELADLESALVQDILDKLSPDEQKSCKLVRCEGDLYLMKVTPRENVTYELDSGKKPLEEMLNLFPDAVDLVSISVKEKGSRVRKIVDADSNDLSSSEKSLRDYLTKFRVSKPGKPTISIETK